MPTVPDRDRLDDTGVARADEVPSDFTTLPEVIDFYEAAGFTGGFAAQADGYIRCSQCDSVLDAALVPMHSLRRMEGASDPSEMAAVVALTCPACQTKGTLVLSYGPMASAEDADVLMRLRDLRDDDMSPADSAPGEAAGT